MIAPKTKTVKTVGPGRARDQENLFSGPPAEPRSGAVDDGGQAGGAEADIVAELGQLLDEAYPGRRWVEKMAALKASLADGITRATGGAETGRIMVDELEPHPDGVEQEAREWLRRSPLGCRLLAARSDS